MSQRRKNATINSFFKPVPRSQTLPQSSSTTSARPSSPVASSSPISQKTSTPLKQKLAAQNYEIRDSDDEDGSGYSSDNSLMELSDMLGYGQRSKASPNPAQDDPFSTPRAKRTQVKFDSPLPSRPKGTPRNDTLTHKFDMKALARDAREAAAVFASYDKSQGLSDGDSDQDDEEVTTGRSSRSVLKTLAQDEDGKDAQKVLRAVQRSHGSHSQLWYCFFDQAYTTPPSTAVPKKYRKGPWVSLTQGDLAAREQAIVLCLPLTVLKTQGLPDELLNWILDELCVLKSAIMRHEYCNLAAYGSLEENQWGRVLTAERLEELFIRLGATEEIRERHEELHMSRPVQSPYPGRDWSNVAKFLSLLCAIAEFMTVDAVRWTAQTLLRMSMDRFLLYNADVLIEFEGAIQEFLGLIPADQWDDFCSETCSLLYTIVKAQSVRINALACLPARYPRVHELRRRLAVSFLHNNPTLSRHHPEDVVNITDIINRFSDSDFAVDYKTDFTELRAYILLLDIAVDDGSFDRSSSNLEDEKKFNAEIDELAERLQYLWRQIDDTGMKLARTEAKTVIEWVQQRLLLSVRTKRKPAIPIFDIPGEEEDQSLPQQQKFMRGFLEKFANRRAAEKDRNKD